MIQFHIRLYDVAEDAINVLKNSDEDWDFDTVFKTNYMKCHKGDWYEVMDLRCDSFHTEGKEICFRVALNESCYADIILEQGDFGWFEVR